jgi:hypothetical protein
MQATSYKGHRADVRLAVHNSKSKVMVSVDERCLKLWRPFTGKELGGYVIPAARPPLPIQFPCSLGW